MSRQLLIGQESKALEAWVRLLRGHAALRRSLSASLQEEHGLGINEFEALLLLSRAEDAHLRRVDLAERLQLTPSGVTRLLAGLEGAGLVEKATCSSDARVTARNPAAETSRARASASRTLPLTDKTRSSSLRKRA